MRTLRRAAPAPTGTPAPRCPLPTALAASASTAWATPFKADHSRTGDRTIGRAPSTLGRGEGNHLAGAQGVLDLAWGLSRGNALDNGGEELPALAMLGNGAPIISPSAHRPRGAESAGGGHGRHGIVSRGHAQGM
eukprot:15173246-Alexandrium_andersonii.AAC.1